ncbi:epoxyqueuosine reductase QueH [uncultured Ruminococcus sp.]|uniref:epoxyqueuosine reductase QueH n=1 Tax=uncultured Ruminococcus sp. TaxID=165186 RepID=UPI00292EA4B0|nr:epoxyqueuosine reductase QueH [uncultured Ruminococcus sp.]
MNKRNYQKELDALIERNTREGIRPRLLLHVCCAVCASYVLEYLAPHFDITIAYYNPNITEESEYRYRYSELRRYVAEAGLSGSVHFTEVDYDPEAFLTLTEGREEEREGGARCALCFRQRLEYTARLCRDGGYDCFATTLTISPLKNAVTLNTIGEQLAEEYGVSYLCSDFKKKEGYKRSIELSKQYHLYRQNYCGCLYSKKEAESRTQTTG